MIQIKTDQCKHCLKCVNVCPQKILCDDGGRVTARGAERCLDCGHCMDVCSHDAIVHDAFPKERVREIRREILPSPESVLELIRSRRSNRQMSDNIIPTEWLDMIQEAAHYAPTAENSRKVQLHVITSEDMIWGIERSVMGLFMRLARPLMWKPVKALLKPLMKTTYEEARELTGMYHEMLNGKRPITRDCTAMLVITAPRGYSFGYQDCNLAYQNASLMAQSLGVAQVYMGFVQVATGVFGKKKTARLLGIPTDQKPYAIMGLGIPKFQYDKYTVPR